MNGWPIPMDREDEAGKEWVKRKLDELFSGSFKDAALLLHALLPVAVADMIDRMQHESWAERMGRIEDIKARWDSEGRNCFGEALMCRTKPGASQQEFVDLATLIAVMAFQPGGVECFGWRWEENGCEVHEDDGERD